MPQTATKFVIGTLSLQSYSYKIMYVYVQKYDLVKSLSE